MRTQICWFDQSRSRSPIYVMAPIPDTEMLKWLIQCTWNIAMTHKTIKRWTFQLGFNITRLKWSTFECNTTEIQYCSLMQLISIYGIYIAPLHGNYSEAPPAQARAKKKVLRRLQNELEKSCGRECNSKGRPFQIEGPAAEKALFCLVAM